MSETVKPATGQPGVEIAEIEGFITRALASVGVPPEDASHVAALMAEVREADPKWGNQCSAQHSDHER
jgi:hypothetical protein